MITDEQYNEWFRKATRKQKVFVNTYLKTLSTDAALKEAGYCYKNPSIGRWKTFNLLFPVIQYKLAKYELEVSKNFIICNWIKLLQSDDRVAAATALKELSKIFGYVEQNTKIDIENNIPQTPVLIKFNKE